MRKGKLDLDALAERLELPPEALGALLVTVLGRRRVLVENHRGVEEYSEVCVRLRSAQGTLAVYGDALRIRVLGRRKLALEGDIRSVEWEE